MHAYVWSYWDTMGKTSFWDAHDFLLSLLTLVLVAVSSLVCTHHNYVKMCANLVTTNNREQPSFAVPFLLVSLDWLCVPPMALQCSLAV